MILILRKIAGCLMIPLCCLLLFGCGGSGGGGDDALDPASGSDWDNMEWDKGQWS